MSVNHRDTRRKKTENIFPRREGRERGNQRRRRMRRRRAMGDSEDRQQQEQTERRGQTSMRGTVDAGSKETTREDWQGTHKRQSEVIKGELANSDKINKQETGKGKRRK